MGLSDGKKNAIGAGTSTGAHLHIGIANGKVTSTSKGTIGETVAQYFKDDLFLKKITLSK